jgi:rsbT antagonist protein RsbS
MDVTILEQGPFLIASVQAALNDADMLELHDDLIKRAISAKAHGLIIDVTMLDVIDSFGARTLREIALNLGPRGTDTVVVGIQPEVAFAMVRLGLDLEGVPTVHDLEEGLTFLRQRRAAAVPGSV